MRIRRISGIKTGRPPKFSGPRRHVTMTLPERTLAKLATVDSDRAQAIVKLTDAAVPPGGNGRKQVEVVEVAAGLGIIIVVGPCEILQKIKGLRLVEVAPTRFLLTIPVGTPIDSVELSVTDLLESAMLNDQERSTLCQLSDLMRSLRRKGVFSKAEMLFVDTQAIA